MRESTPAKVKISNGYRSFWNRASEEDNRRVRETIIGGMNGRKRPQAVPQVASVGARQGGAEERDTTSVALSRRTSHKRRRPLRAMLRGFAVVLMWAFAPDKSEKQDR